MGDKRGLRANSTAQIGIEFYGDPPAGPIANKLPLSGHKAGRAQDFPQTRCGRPSEGFCHAKMAERKEVTLVQDPPHSTSAKRLSVQRCEILCIGRDGSDQRREGLQAVCSQPYLTCVFDSTLTAFCVCAAK